MLYKVAEEQDLWERRYNETLDLRKGQVRKVTRTIFYSKVHTPRELSFLTNAR